MTVFRVTILALALVLAAPAGAAQTNYYYGEGPYVGFAVGVSVYDLELGNWDADGSLTSGSVDDSDVGVKFYWGYNFSNNFGLELFYVNLGETAFEGVSSGVATGGDNFWESGNVSGYTKNKGYGFSASAKLPLGRYLDIYGKAGMYWWDVDEYVFNAVDSRPIGDDGSDMLFGGGLGLNITDQSALRLEWERYINVYDVYDVDLFSLGFVHKF